MHETNGTLPDGRFIKTIGRPFVWNEIALIIKYKRLEIRKMHMEYKTKDNKVLSIDIKKIEFGAVIVLSFISDESTIKMHIYITPHGAPSLPDLREPDIIDAQINVKLPKNKANAERVTLNDIFTKLGIEKFWEKVENFVMKLDDAYQAPQKRAAYQDPQERKEYIQKQKEYIQKQKEYIQKQKEYIQKQKEDMQKQKEDSKEKVQADMEKLNKALSEIDNI